jgi:hypothetical protein
MLVTTVEALRSTYAYFSTHVSQPYTKWVNGSGKIWQSLLAVKTQLGYLTQAIMSLAQQSKLTLHNMFLESLTGGFSANTFPLLALPPEILLHILSYLEIKDQIACLGSCTTTLYELYTAKEKNVLLTAKEHMLRRQVKAAFSDKSDFNLHEIYLFGNYFARQTTILSHANVSARERYMASQRILLSIRPFKNEKAYAVQAHLELAWFKNQSSAQIVFFLKQLAKYHLPLAVCLLVLVKNLSVHEKTDFLKAIFSPKGHEVDTHLLQAVSSEKYLKAHTLGKIYRQLYDYYGQG